MSFHSEGFNLNGFEIFLELGGFMHRGINVLSASAMVFALGAPAIAGNMTDCTYTGDISGKTATIEVKGGEPVSYKWGSYKTKKVSQRGNTISIDQAAIENLKVGVTQSGKAAFQGKWKFNGRSADVTFICG